jgi:transcription-repair coupling factor (superfamily II helicase)
MIWPDVLDEGRLRAEVDVLTLTATPIPRTLNMAMAGMRDLSIIATPPVERHLIKTFVSTWNDALIREACQREINRGGQVYFLHNEVETIETSKRIASAADRNELKDLQVEMIDRFGLLPEPTKALFAVTELKLTGPALWDQEDRGRPQGRAHRLRRAAEHRPHEADPAGAVPAQGLQARSGRGGAALQHGHD